MTALWWKKEQGWAETRTNENANELRVKLVKDVRFCIARHVVVGNATTLLFALLVFEPSFQFIVITDMMMIKAWMAICYARTILTHTQLLTLFSSFVHFFWQLGKPLFLQFAIKKSRKYFFVVLFFILLLSCRV